MRKLNTHFTIATVRYEQHFKPNLCAETRTEIFGVSKVRSEDHLLLT